ncbi:MAG: ABC transporter ATP-binding protein [Chloroflexi bacterium]|nr:ABC transporter ATP-binding protein [Chloroflexota bacterium]
MAPILETQNLHAYFFTKAGTVRAVNGVDLTLMEGQVLALVGESGSGKTATALAMIGLLPYPGKVVEGEVRYQGEDLLRASESRWREVRGKEISMVFQDAQAALNPTLSIGQQVEELLATHTRLGKRELRARAIELLTQVDLPEPELMLRRYSFHLSGGQCQRVMLSMATALSPRVLIADEPTSNLDVTLQAEMLARLKRLQQEMNTSILLITHDMGVVAQMADEVAVMYAGTIVERAETRLLFRHPSHPYTWALFQALPRLDQRRSLRPLRGTPPDMINLPDQCPFIPRCPKATNVCRLSPRPPLDQGEAGHPVACYNPMLEPQE